jgi:diaminopimelate decarboxylase
MDNFIYKAKQLHVENVAISDIASFVGTPFYVYSQSSIEQNYKTFQNAMSGTKHLICYAMKANSNQAVLKILGNLGAGMDVVSGGEYLRAKAAGIPGDRIVFSGVGKTREEINLAIRGGIRQFNVESEPELSEISKVASELDTEVPVTLRINPDVDAKTHLKISTGKSENKFGIPLYNARRTYAFAASLQGIRIIGIDVHIGSQLSDLTPYKDAFAKIRQLTEVLRADGHNIDRVDLGGGLGIIYESSNDDMPSPADYGCLIKEVFDGLNCELELEPGRWIVGNAGLMISSVIYPKKGEGRNFLIIDAAMNDLLRPALYDSHHDILPVKEPFNSVKLEKFDIVGPVCETGDTFATQRIIPNMGAGELLAFRSAGAYGAVMASEYNSRPLIPEVLVSGNKFAVIRDRPSIQDIISRDNLPDWL